MWNMTFPYIGSQKCQVGMQFTAIDSVTGQQFTGTGVIAIIELCALATVSGTKMSKINFSQLLLDDLIAVALLDKAEGVIKLPDWQRTLRGEVIAVGPGRMLPLGERAPMETKVGDRVTFSATAGMD